MITLFLDTSLKTAIIAIVKDNSILYEFKKEYNQDMSKYLVNEINNAFQKVHLKPTDLTNIVVAIGPGSFTGVRMGLTVAKTMAYALNIELFSISSLLLMSLTSKTNSLVTIDARRGYVYGALYDNNHHILIEESYILLNELLEKANKYQYDLITESKINYNVCDAVNHALKSKPVKIHSLKPNYLKITQAEKERLEKDDSKAN